MNMACEGVPSLVTLREYGARLDPSLLAGETHMYKPLPNNWQMQFAVHDL